MANSTFISRKSRKLGGGPRIFFYDLQAFSIVVIHINKEKNIFLQFFSCLTPATGGPKNMKTL